MSEKLLIRKMNVHKSTDRYRAIIPREFVNKLVEEIKEENKPIIKKHVGKEEDLKNDPDFLSIYTGWLKIDDDLLISLFYEESKVNFQKIRKNPYQYMEYKNALIQKIYKKLTIHFELNPILLKEKVSREIETPKGSNKYIKLLEEKRQDIENGLASLSPLVKAILAGDKQKIMQVLLLFKSLEFSEEEKKLIEEAKEA